MVVCVHFLCKRYFSICVHKPMDKKHDVWHTSITVMKVVWQTDSQLQRLIHTTIDPFSFGCLDKLTPSHWLSRSSRQVFPQRSPLGLPMTQRPTCWTEDELKGHVVANRRALRGDTGSSSLVDLTPSLSFIGCIYFSRARAKVGLHEAKGSVLVLNRQVRQWGLASLSLLKRR